jgi:hypothetical protein
MARVILIHWNAAEASERIERLHRAGHDAAHLAQGGPAAMRSLGDDPPDAFVIDLARLPSPGRDIAAWLAVHGTVK